jgi:hypothetical protein
MTRERHECPDCETIFVNASCCPACGWRAPVWSTRPVLPAERPCTLEQNRQALGVLQAVLACRITANEGLRRLADIFGADVIVRDS